MSFETYNIIFIHISYFNFQLLDMYVDVKAHDFHMLPQI
jgi:D-alanyl-lipoteichoic acid acyltransferase DltB (MBOAT superfamily)